MSVGPAPPEAKPQRPDSRPPTPAQDETIAFLARGASYGDAGAAVERIETHVSLIFLVGARAFKMKRAVTFSYLDYGTLALRRRYCEAELALGKRLAPTLYRTLHAVTREASGALALDGKGEPVEFLLEMRRFGEADLFDKLATRGLLTPTLMRETADAIAGFHAAAEPDPGHGGSAAIRAVIEDCDANLRRATGVFEAGQAEALHAALAAAWRQAAPLLDRRRTEGKVRRCHGDLHLRNICLLDGKPTLFDGIEFSAEIASIDVLYDLAFLLMDLHHRKHDELGNLVFNRYLDRTGDTGGLAALPLFLALRAAIRAHVTAAAALQHPDGAGAGAEQARAYLALARELLRPRAPRLIAIGGVSGTGKSSLARAVAPELGPVPGARMVHTDVIRKRLSGVAPETRLTVAAYSREMNDRVYGSLYTEAEAALRAGYAAIADAVFLLPEERAAIAATARSAGVPFIGIWLEAPEDVLAKRIAARHGDISDANVEVLRLQLSHDPGAIDWHRLDAGRAIDDLAAAVRALPAT
ncbi:MAG TPA: AAA family ATPase [Stellaceae bacterium]|nr:AAA family ATPase [Stellaceae bacterium]